MAVEVFRMIAETTRLRLLWHLLVDQELSVNELAQAVHKSSSGVSQHLAKLRTAQVVFADPRQPDFPSRRERARAPTRRGRVFHARHTSGGVPVHDRADGEFSELSDT